MEPIIFVYTFEFEHIKVLHFYKVQTETSCRLSAVKVHCRSTVPNSRELMQLDISQSQHSLVAVLRHIQPVERAHSPHNGQINFTNFYEVQFF